MIKTVNHENRIVHSCAEGLLRLISKAKIMNGIKASLVGLLLFFLVCHGVLGEAVEPRASMRAGRNPEIALTGYPRPLLWRKNWSCLNGLWGYAITPKKESPSPPITGQILVPFAPETSLSLVREQVGIGKILWYQRKFAHPKPKNGRTLLHFGAVDYEASVVLNGKEVGSHKGGFTAFSFDITEFLDPGENELQVRVVDDVEGTQLHGKQSLNPRTIWYPNITGIWQTVWLEDVPERSISSLKYSSDIHTGTLGVSVGLEGPALKGEKIRMRALHQGALRGEVESSNDFDKLSFQFKEPMLWSPEKPNLYDIKVELLDGKGKVVDTVESYAALREITRQADERGDLRICINGVPTFLFGPLDQGWWPDGYLTPPSDEAVVSELKFIKDCGFNMVRKHVKVEPARYYYHCDRLGIVVWQDQVSSNFNQSAPGGRSPQWTRLLDNPVDGDWEKEAHDQWVTEYQRMVDMLRNNPSVAIYSPFNEAWGQHKSMEIGTMAVNYDKTRLVCLASGGNFWPLGHIVSNHSYPYPSFPTEDPRFDNYVKVVGEMGGHGWAMPGHVWDAQKSWGHGGLCSSVDEWKNRYKVSLQFLSDAKKNGLAAAVYTQTADTFTEVNGLMTFDRIPKAEASWFKEVNSLVMQREPPLKAPTPTPTPGAEAAPAAK